MEGLTAETERQRERERECDAALPWLLRITRDGGNYRPPWTVKLTSYASWHSLQNRGGTIVGDHG